MSTNKERKSMIKVRGGYSDRNGYNPVCNVVQVDDLDDRTRAILSNEVFKIIDIVFDLSGKNRFNSENYYNQQFFLKEILSEVFGEINYFKDSLSWKDVFIKIDNVIRNAVINEVLDIIEFICVWLDSFCDEKRAKACEVYGYCDEQQNDISFFSYINSVFERECIWYRFVNGVIIENIDKTEITAIEEASATEFDGCNIHIKKSTHYLYDRENPDYKNSIKESISAVESICKIIAGDGATLGDALKVLEKKRSLNKQLKSAFDKLYSYTNAEGGIRHGEGLFASDVSFEEAKFMLVSCCAFINYLIAEYGKIEG